MSIFVAILIASLAVVSQAYPHNTETIRDGHHHAFLDLAATIAVSMTHNNTEDESAMLTPYQLMSCIPEEFRKKIHQQSEAQCHDNPDHTPSIAATCLLDMMKAVDNATGVVDMAVLEALTIEPTSLTADQKILASGSLKSCMESNFTLPPPSDTMLASRNMTEKEFVTKYDHESIAMRVMVCVAKALIENGCSSTSPIAALVIAPVDLDDNSSSGENSSHEDDHELIAGTGRKPLA